MRIFLILTLLFMTSVSFSQNFDDLDDYTVDEFYEKIELDYGTLGEDGSEISFVFVKTELDAGIYEIALTDGPNDLYEIKGTDFFITFRGYFGYAGYNKECILKVEGGYSSATVYKLE